MIKERLRIYSQRMQTAYTAEPLFHENEVRANRTQTKVLACTGIILIAICLATQAGLFSFARDVLTPAVIEGLVEIVLLCVIARVRKYDAWWLKYLLLTGILVIYGRLDMMLTHKAELLIVMPILCSCRYYSKKLTIWVSVLSTVVFAVSAYFGSIHGLLNLNDLSLPVGTTMTTTGKWIDSAVEQVGYDQAAFTRNVLLYSFVPKWLIFLVISLLCARSAGRGRDLVLRQKTLTEERTAIGTELSLATNIQANILPNTFPPFPDRKDLEIYATMTPAKQVGGDFYDFFLIDDTHLGLVIADVSNKGVPAALFMMASKMLIKTNAMAGLSPAALMEAVNDQLCENNQEQMFVTVWFGVLDLDTGLLRSVNAGHKRPLLRAPGGDFAPVKGAHGLVVGGMPAMRYREVQVQLVPGSTLFLYTDGVTEATNASLELYEEDRLMSVLARFADAAPETILRQVRQDVDAFVASAPQFDDLTMLCVRWKGTQ